MRNRRKRNRNGLKAVVVGIMVTTAIILLMVGNNAEQKKNYAFTETTVYYVEKGDVLWNIAQQYSDNRHDVRQVIYDIEKLSGCNANLQIGEKLIIPVYEVMKK